MIEHRFIFIMPKYVLIFILVLIRIFLFRSITVNIVIAMIRPLFGHEQALII